jgi:hypothetical protein
MRRFLRVLTIVVVAVAAATASVTLTYALWQKSILVNSAAVRTSPAVIKSDNLGSDNDIVTATDSTITVPFTQADATAIYNAAHQVHDGVVDWVKPFAIVGETTGTIGFSYTVDLPDTSDSIYGYDLFLFPVAGPENCDPADPPSLAGMAHPSAADLAVQPALSKDYQAEKQYEQWYCMAAHFVPLTYTNVGIGTVHVFDLSDTTSCTVPALCDLPNAEVPIPHPAYVEEDEWVGGLLTDPATEPELTFDFQVNVFDYES